MMPSFIGWVKKYIIINNITNMMVGSNFFFFICSLNKAKILLEIVKKLSKIKDNKIGIV